MGHRAPAHGPGFKKPGRRPMQHCKLAEKAIYTIYILMQLQIRRKLVKTFSNVADPDNAQEDGGDRGDGEEETVATGKRPCVPNGAAKQKKRKKKMRRFTDPSDSSDSDDGEGISRHLSLDDS